MKPPATSLSTFVKSSAIVLVANVLTKGVYVLLLPFYTHTMSPTALGVSDVVVNFTGLIYPILVMGLDAAFSKFYYEHDAVLATVRRTMLVMSIVPLVACAAARPLSLALFGVDRYTLVVVAALVSIALNLWLMPPLLWLRMENKMTAFGLINIGGSVVTLMATIVFVKMMHLGAASIALSMVASNLAMVIASLIVVPRPRVQAGAWALVRRMLAFSLPLLPTTICAWILNLSDRSIVLMNQGAADVGVYGVAARLAQIVSVLAGGVTIAYTSFAYAAKDTPSGKRHFRLIFRLTTDALALVAFVLSLFSRECVALLATASYSHSAGVVGDLVFAQVLAFMTALLTYGISFSGRTLYIFWATLAGAALNLILNVIFVPTYGIAAAALTTLLGSLLILIMTTWASLRLYPCRYGLVETSVVVTTLYLIGRFGHGTPFALRLGLLVISLVVALRLHGDTLRMALTWARRGRRSASKSPKEL